MTTGNPDSVIQAAALFHDRLVKLYRETWAARDAGRRPRLSVNRAVRLWDRAQEWRNRVGRLAVDAKAGDLCERGTPAERAFTIGQQLDSTSRWIISAATGRRAEKGPLTMAEYETWRTSGANRRDAQD